jgi:hypothetical protein
MNTSAMDTEEGSGTETPSPLETFQNIIADETLFQGDPKEVKEAQSADALKSYQKLIAKFMQVIPQINFENIESNLLAFSADLRALDEEVGADSVIPGYVGHHTIAQLIHHLIQLLNNHLPAAHRLHKPNSVDFIIQIGRLLYPKIFGNSAWSLVRWDDLLDPETAHQCVPVITEDVDAEFTIKAEASRDLLISQWKAQLKKGPISPDVSAEFEERMNHIQDIYSGRYPCGVNTVKEERWKQFDIGCCLDPAYDQTDYLHILYPRNIAYLMHLAKEMKHDIMERVKQKPELAKDLYTITHAARLDAFIQHKTLPEGWRFEEENVEMK